jgi:hypothetical protein
MLRRLMALLVLAGFLLSLPTTAGASNPLIRPHQFTPKGAPRGSTALGAVPATQPLSLSIVLPPSNSAGLQSVLANLYNPSSPQYHQWLKPGQFATEFGPSPSTVTSVESWLHGRGLSSTSLTGSTIEVAAPAKTVSTALGTSFERYRSPSGARGYIAQDAPLVPQNLASGEITSIIGLDTVPKYVPEDLSLLPANGLRSQGSLQPAFTSSCPTPANLPANTDSLAQVGAAYGIDGLVNNGEDGQGETIGVYELDPYTASDLTRYFNCAGLANNVSTVTIDGGEPSPDANGIGEADLDIEQVATQSPDASIIAYEGPNDGNLGPLHVWQKIVTDDVAQVISTSWGECEELAFTPGDNDPFTGLFSQAALQGQSIFAATGDSGAQDCFPEVGSTASTVDYPASDPFVTAVGGTTLGSNSEVVWNNCPPSGSLSCADINGAGGGGVSEIAGSRQPYQPVIDPADKAGNCANTCREVPDVSANAGTPMEFAFNNGFNGGFDRALGTSFAAPLWAGLTADRNVGCTTTTGLFNGALYALNKAGSYGTAFNDIITGNNDLTGSSGSDFSALTGYDLASGIGTPRAAGLSCPEITSVGTGQVGQTVVINGLGLANSTFTFGGTPATIVGPATDTQVSVIVPAGSGTVTVSGASSAQLGSGTMTKPFTYPAITTSSLAPGIVGTPYSQTLTAVGVPASQSWTIIAGSLPSPLVLNASTGVISGTPSASGPAQSVTIQVTAGSIVLSAPFSIQVFGSSSTTKPTVSPTAADLGNSVTYKATVSSAAGTPNGTVAFSIGSTALCTTPALVGGTAECNSTAAPAGQDSVTSTYLPTDQSAALSVGTTSLEISSGPYSPLAPVRICDTRAHDPSNLASAAAPAAQCSGASNFGSPILGGTSKNIQVAGFFGIPATATSVVLNLTVVNPVASGFVTAYPTGANLPGTSTINYTAGEVVPNLTDVGIGAGGEISVYSLVQTDLVVDIEGYTSPSAQEGAGAGLYTALPSPERLCDTRPGNVSNLTVAPDNQCNGSQNQGTTLTAANPSINVKVVHGTTIPPQATAAVFNVTVANPTAAGFLTVYPQGGQRPFASNVNYAAGQVTTNRVVVPLSTTGTLPGEITVFSSAPADVIVDVSGYYSAASGTQFNAEAAPVRICDTRPLSPLSPTNQCTNQPVTSGTPLTVNVWGHAGVPTTATAVVVNLTGIAPTQPTFLAVFPGTFSGSSDLNPAVGEVRANMAVATINPQNGQITIVNSAGSANVIVDVLGWYS